MSDSFPTRSIAGGVAVVVFLAAFFVMLEMGMHRTVLLIPLALGLAALLCALKPLVEEDKHSGLYFAVGILAFMIFFLHETYALQGKERTFPLIIGYTGIVLSVLDVASVTETALGRFITHAFGAMLDPSEIKPRTVTRELLAFASMGLGVLGIWLIGFLVASPVFVFLWMWLWGDKPARYCLYGAAATYGFIWLLFEKVLQYELYRGVLLAPVIEDSGNWPVHSVGLVVLGSLALALAVNAVAARFAGRRIGFAAVFGFNVRFSGLISVAWAAWTLTWMFDLFGRDVNNWFATMF